MITRTKVENTIGKTFADKLDEMILDVSPSLQYTRRTMVEELGCANFVAAARLEKVLKRLQINTATQLHKMDPFSLARVKGVGSASMFVVMCILDVNKYDVEKWWGWNDTNLVKFSTFKSHAMRRASKRKHVA